MGWRTALVIDQHGILFEVYKKANLSFIGGSFKKNVHSVMEPLAWGCPVVVGPKNKNNREAQDFKLKFIGRDTPIVSEIKSDVELIELIKTIQKIDQDIEKTILHEVKMKTGASFDVANWVLEN